MPVAPTAAVQAGEMKLLLLLLLLSLSLQCEVVRLATARSGSPPLPWPIDGSRPDGIRVRCRVVDDAGGLEDDAGGMSFPPPPVSGLSSLSLSLSLPGALLQR